MPALLLDLDGTLADSLDAMRGAFFAFIREVGGREEDFPFEHFNGPPLTEIVRIVKAQLGLAADAEALLAVYQEMVDRIYLDIGPAPGAKALLQQARSAGWTVGVVTSNSRPRLSRWLAHVGFAPFCDLAVCGEDVALGKPSPAPYLKALNLASASAAEAYAVEDSRQGAQSAQRAGLTVFGYCPAKRAVQDWPPGVTVIEDFSSLADRLFGLDSAPPPSHSR